MFYVLWVVGVLFAVMTSAVITIGLDKSGEFEE